MHRVSEKKQMISFLLIFQALILNLEIRNISEQKSKIRRYQYVVSDLVDSNQYAQLKKLDKLSQMYKIET